MELDLKLKLELLYQRVDSLKRTNNNRRGN